MQAEAIDEELRMLEFKLAQLKRDYDQYFLGNRPREPVQLRGDVNKAVIELTNTAIKNTASRFKFTSICSRYQAFRRQWDDTLRKIESVRKRIEASGRDIRLEVDGGIKVDNIRRVADAGADSFVAGSAIFGKPDYAAVITQMRAALAA